ncbi:vacuolar-sorting protein SNF8-like [Tigriopus californicus]|uniref:vacuolar-sorting protein SNF8-like n=1 Tax=Tigriopus californicus TaxID=6832 RepID=UPI0027DAB103|nr:vacuolar-sorting protein SNF8-like [Tigriopus californicus]
MRRRAGVGAIHKKKLEDGKYKDKSNVLAEHQLSEMSRQLETFRANLEEFARDHKAEIKKDPAFRKHFQDMCATIGVDPLASGKGFWSEMLGVGDFYYELGVQIVEVCMATSHRTGGLMELSDLRKKLVKARGKSRHHQEISNDDLLRAIKKLKVLGNGFTVIPLNSGRYLVQSIPGEFSMDQTAILQKAESTSGYVSLTILREEMGWNNDRSQRALDQLIKEGFAWIDTQGTSEASYWFPSIFTSSME